MTGYWMFNTGTNNVFPDGVLDDAARSVARRVVVIDPEDTDAVRRLVRCFWDANTDDGDSDAVYMAAALREFAAPTPPKPEEPQGLGAVVEDTDGKCWVRTDEPGVANPWCLANGYTTYPWRDITVARVLAEGVTP